MAIIDDITVRVLVNDEPAQEYEVESETDAGPNYIAKYIEAVSEARFKIKLEMAPSMLFTSDGLIFELSLDGKRVMKQTCHRREHHAGRRVFSLKGKRVSGPAGTVRLPFLFSEIKRPEEATSGMADLSENILDGIGTIIVAVRRVTINGRQLRKGFSRTTELGNITEVPENKCKGINLTHSVKFGEVEELKTAGPSHYVYGYPDGEVPFATFEFKYCSKKALQSMLLIPKSPLPVSRLPSPARPEEPSLEELNVEELRALARHQREALHKYESGRVKTEPSRGVKRGRDDEDSKVNLLRSVRAKHRPTETINLCGDD